MKRIKKSISIPNIERATDLAESFVNGNIEFVKKEVKKSKNPVGLALLVMRYLPDNHQRSFMEVFSKEL